MYLLHQFNRGKLIAIAFSIVITGTVIAGPGNYNQQGPKLVGSGAVGTALQGSSVALSADGNTALVGGLRDDNFTGAVWVFTRSAGVWSQEGQKLVGTGAIGRAAQGGSVGLSADGNTAVVGGTLDNNTAGGAVWVFTRSGGVWTQQGPKLVGADATAGNGGRQGIAVAVSADGNTLAEGGYFDNGLTSECETDPPTFCTQAVGAVWVFTRSNGVWTQQGSKLIGTGPDQQVAQQGYVVSLSADGNTLAEEGLQAGAVWVFTRSGGVWQQQGGELEGGHCSLTGDGNTLLIDNTFFHRKNGVWTQTGQFLSLPDRVHQTALSADGSTAAGNSGTAEHIAVFTNTGGVWSFQHEYFGNDESSTLPHPIALSANGNTMIEGANDGSLGAVWVFASPQLSTTLTHTGNFHQGQTGATYTIAVTNVGDRAIHAAPTSAVNLVDKLPAGLTATGLFGNGWICTLATLSCTRADGLAVGASFPPVTVIVNVASNAPASVTNVATASGGGSNWGNAKDPTTILP